MIEAAELTSTKGAPLPVEFTDAEARLAVEVQREFADVPDWEVRGLAALGWTAEDWSQIERVARWAAREGLLGWEAERQTLTGLLRSDWESLTRHHGLSAAVAHRWVALFAGAPDREAYRLAGIHATEDGVTESDPGSLRLLAYAAGIPLAEALAAVEAGRLDCAALRTLAALRGWRLSPDLIESAVAGPPAP